jgi:hypothetical protein
VFATGLVTLKDKASPAVAPSIGFPLVVVAVRGFGLTAFTGATRGTRRSMLENARSDRIVPELNFLTYAFVSVFNIFILLGRDGLFKVDGRVIHFSRTFALRGLWKGS